MMTALKQILNSICMYVYLIYYTERIRRDKAFMIREALNENRRMTLEKRARYDLEINWKL